MEINSLFIVFHGINNSGISKKIKSQVKAFENTGINTSFSYLSTDNNGKYDGRFINNKILEKYVTTFGIHKRWHWRFKFKKLIEYIKNENINTVFIRYTHFANPFFIRFLRKLKKMGVFIVMEIPTFPYDAEYNNAKTSIKIAKYVEVYYRQFFNKYVGLMVTFSNANEIFGVRTIKINNGIDLNSIPLKDFSKRKDELNLIAVASFEFWHGYDRLIEGLKKYYANNPQLKVVLHFVGNVGNRESEKYKYLVEKYNLGNYVIFHGFKTGKELDELFDVSDLAIGCLGVHRKGIKYIKSLKNSEYCARGIPFVYSEIDDSFEKKPFIIKVPANENPIDIDALINFSDSKKIIPSEIRKFAEQNLTWDIQMTKIIEAIPYLIQS